MAKELKLNYNAIIKKLEAVGNDYALQLKSQLLNKGKRATGDLIKSIKSEVELKGDGNYTVIISAAKHLTYVNDGRRAGAKPPPIAPIAAWIKVKGIAASPYAVAKSIAKNGIQATHVIEATMKEMQRDSNKDLHQSIVDEVKKLLEQFAQNVAQQNQKNKNVTMRLRRK